MVSMSWPICHSSRPVDSDGQAPGPMLVSQRFVQLADESAIKRTDERQLHRQVGL